MLAPMDIDPIQNSIKAFYLNICAADQVAFTSQSINIFPIQRESPWVAKVRSSLIVLSESGNEWSASRIGIVSGMVNTFLNYAALFQAMEPIFVSADSASVVVHILDRLIDSVTENIAVLRTGSINFSDCQQRTLGNIDPLNDCIGDGWRQLAASEKKVMELSQEIALTQSKLITAEGAISLASLQSIPVSGYQNICSGAVRIVSSMVIDGLALSYLSVGILLFSFGKTIYDIVANAKAFEAENARLSQAALDFSMEEKALAQTKALIQLLYGLKDTINAQGNALTQIETFWKDEKRNLLTVRERFSAMTTDFDKYNSEALQIPIGSVVWRTLNGTAQDLLAWINKPFSTDTARVELTI